MKLRVSDQVASCEAIWSNLGKFGAVFGQFVEVWRALGLISIAKLRLLDDG